MAKKLFHVKVDLYVMAEDEWDAKVAATQAKFDIFECTAREADSLLPEWEDAVPYNASDSRTCAQIFSRNKTRKPRASYPIGSGSRA